MSAEETYSVPARPGTPADMSRRMDRMETAHEVLAKEVSGLTTTIARVELNLNHSEELGKYRSDLVTSLLSSLESKINRADEKLDTFIDYIQKIVSGEQSTAQSRQNDVFMAEYMEWRKTVDLKLEDTSVLSTQLSLLGRLAVFLTGGSLIGTALAVYAVFFQQ